MKYIISKTSHTDEDYAKLSDGTPDWASDPIPHPDAKQELLENWDLRTCKTPEEFNKRLADLGGPWNQHGTGHTTWSGGIKRRMADTPLWTIEIKDLIAFTKANGRIVLSPPNTDRYGPNALFHIEIYNDYRE